MNRFKSICLIIILTTLFIGCKESYQSPFIGKKIHFDPQLKYISDSARIRDIPNRFMGGTYRFFTIHDAICPKCIYGKLNMVDRALYSGIHHMDKIEVVHVLNISRSDSIYFVNRMYEKVDVKGVLLWDRNFIFEETNELFTPNETERVLFVDPNNQVLQTGDPLMDRDAIDRYNAIIDTIRGL
ncbi:hypothetical protein K4L44_14030 [Halosquirtibacter laminarini]|uniref:Uncharacterized protein n=1 Tax=Halosquirtibacter laminarini TaxID=3374600 RepID=A0AC61NDN6_9BACT|nr:hypothetical protein K4L44_14030 [Prolixibacteraceae bacterium]